jgi:hypothetical protein
MKRREFITLLGAAAAAWPAAARAQDANVRVIGFLHSGLPEPNAKRVAGLRKGLAESGFVEGKNIAIDFRWAGGHDDQAAGIGGGPGAPARCGDRNIIQHRGSRRRQSRDLNYPNLLSHRRPSG